jgi:hypothetical protein
MAATDQSDGGDMCGKWMPRAQTTCARKPQHKGDCRTARALQERRLRLTARRRGQTLSTPEARARWRLKHKLKRYGLTHALFDALLEAQGYACGMCRESFADDQAIFIDHDHACCPDEKSSCGECVRGLLCLGCNTALGHIERKYDMARAYLDRPPGQSALKRQPAA